MPARQNKTHQRTLPAQTLVVDNGAYTIKAGYVSEEPTVDDCEAIPNCIARDREKRTWIGHQLEKCKDFGEIVFRRPVEKGYLVNWEAEKAIWDTTFFDKTAKLKCNSQESNLILTEAPNAPSALQTNCDQIIFEEYEFASYSRHMGSSLNVYNGIPNLFGLPPRVSHDTILPVECLLVIDSGFSHTTVTPLFNGRPVQQAIRRLDIGGKFLTNYLKEFVSSRQYNMSGETYVMNEVKEAVCYVSNDFRNDLERVGKGVISERSARALSDDTRSVVVDYVLPDYNLHSQGFMRPFDPAKPKKGQLPPGGVVEETMTLGNERFAVPELLFNPGDVGLTQAGIPEMVLQSLSGLPQGFWPAMLANILVVGGNSKIPGFMERLETELRQLAPAECILRIARAPDPIKSTWLGGANLATNRDALKRIQVTRQEYQEHGGAWLARVFSGAVAR